jgi:hypothetical protein
MRFTTVESDVGVEEGEKVEANTTGRFSICYAKNATTLHDSRANKDKAQTRNTTRHLPSFAHKDNRAPLKFSICSKARNC